MNNKIRHNEIDVPYKGRIAKLWFEEGNFDSYKATVLVPGSKKPIAPLDEGYFNYFQELRTEEEKEQIYQDFTKIYDVTTTEVETSVIKLINQLSSKYDDSDDINLRFVIVYYGMVAEENKEFAKLKKRIKRLGMYQTLIEGMKPRDAANFSKGKDWTELDVIMKERGF